MKKIFALVSLLVLASLVLSACGTPATPVATEAPATSAPGYGSAYRDRTSDARLERPRRRAGGSYG